jgi:hypothetical protein
MMRELGRWALRAISIGLVAGVGGLASAAPPEVVASIDPYIVGDYALGDESTCIECHDETEDFPVLSILKTPHAAMGDPRTPCHPGGTPGRLRSPPTSARAVTVRARLT